MALSGAAGVLIIVGVIVAVAAAAAVGYLLLQRFGRTRPEMQEPSPDEAGRVGRVSAMRKGPPDR